MGNRQDYHENEPRTQGQEDIQDSKHDRSAHQKGPQVHAEGQHGSKTHAHLIEQLQSGPHRESREDRVERERTEAAYEGKRRLVEDREQHQEADKNSEKNRLRIERERGRAEGPGHVDAHLNGAKSTEPRANYEAKGPRLKSETED